MMWLRYPVLPFPAPLISHTFHHPCNARARLLMSQDIIARVEDTVVVMLSPQCFLRIFDQITYTKGIAQRELDRHSSCRYGDIRIVMPRKSVPMRNGKNRHLEAY